MSAEIPQGLTELLEEFAIAVLREKPEDLVAFAGRYFNTMLASRQAEQTRKGADETGMETDKTATGEGMEMGNEGEEKVVKSSWSILIASPPSPIPSLWKILMKKTYHQVPTETTWPLEGSQYLLRLTVLCPTMKRLKRWSI